MDLFATRRQAKPFNRTYGAGDEVAGRLPVGALAAGSRNRDPRHSSGECGAVARA
jgi:hypothetical protein